MKLGDRVRVKETAPKLRGAYSLPVSLEGLTGVIAQDQLLGGYWSVRFDAPPWPLPPGATLPETALELVVEDHEFSA